MEMRRNRETEILAALDTLYLKGFVLIDWDRFYLWFDAVRISKSAWRQVRDEWAHLCEIQGETAALDVHILEHKHFVVLYRNFEKEHKNDDKKVEPKLLTTLCE